MSVVIQVMYSKIEKFDADVCSVQDTGMWMSYDLYSTTLIYNVLHYDIILLGWFKGYTW